MPTASYMYFMEVIMQYAVVTDLISKQLGGELISESEMYSYIDRVIDDINAQLNTCFPTFTEFREQNSGASGLLLDYTPIPDKYIRTVIIPGAAFKYYTTDEEGAYAAPKYEEDYKQGLFYMVRDFSFSVPEEYQNDDQGYVQMAGDNPGLTVRRGGGFW